MSCVRYGMYICRYLVHQYKDDFFSSNMIIKTVEFDKLLLFVFFFQTDISYKENTLKSCIPSL